MISKNYIQLFSLVVFTMLLANCAPSRVKYEAIVPNKTFSNCGFMLRTPTTDGWFSVEHDLKFTIEKMGGVVLEDGEVRHTNPSAPLVRVTAICYSFQDDKTASDSILRHYETFQSGENLSGVDVKIKEVTSSEKVRGSAKCYEVVQSLVLMTPSPISKDFDWSLKWLACQHPVSSNNYIELISQVQSLPGEYPEAWVQEAQDYIQSLQFIR